MIIRCSCLRAQLTSLTGPNSLIIHAFEIGFVLYIHVCFTYSNIPVVVKVVLCVGKLCCENCDCEHCVERRSKSKNCIPSLQEMLLIQLHVIPVICYVVHG